MKVKCERAWGCAPLLVKDAVYDLVEDYFTNGESHFIVQNADGVEFTAPSVFFGEPYKA